LNATGLDTLPAAAHAPASPIGTARAATYPLLSDKHPLRVAFVGQATYFRSCSLTFPCNALEPSFVDHRAGVPIAPVLAQLEQIRPDVVIVFRPEIVPRGAFASLDAITLGYLTEPLPRGEREAHDDLVRRLGYLEMLDPANFDRIVSFDPLMVEAVERVAPVWRSLPLPVADEYFAPVPSGPLAGRALFVGRSTDHRELFLAPVKHHFDVVHVAHGATDEMLLNLLAESDVGINVHNEPYPTFENRCATILAAGNLLVSEALSPTHGLEPSIDFVEMTVPEELQRALFNIQRSPDSFRRMRIRGRMKAEYFRASNVYPRLIADLLVDVRTFGRGRAAPRRSEAFRRPA
jgi:hypothetical protein